MKVKLRKAVVPVFLPYLFPLLLSSWLPLSLLSPLSTLFSFLKFESDDVPHNLELYLMPTVRGIPFSFHYTSLALNSAQAFSSPSVCIIPTPIYEKLNTVPLQADVIVLHLRHLFTPRAFFLALLSSMYCKTTCVVFSLSLNKELLGKMILLPIIDT